MNKPTAIGSHHSSRSASDTWLTPKPILDALGEFDLDPCGFDGWRTAKHHYTKPEDGLARPWNGRIWLNPPYSYPAVTSWMARMATHNYGTALIFARTETKMWFNHIWNQATAVLFLNGRLHFHRPDGKRSSQNAGAPSALIAYGSFDRDRLAESALNGAFVLLQNQFYSILSIPRTWVSIIEEAFNSSSSPLDLKQIYGKIEGHPKSKGNRFWKEQIRKVLQTRPQFVRIAPGTYTLSVCVDDRVESPP